jgi:Flp pilus assembly protein TadG
MTMPTYRLTSSADHRCHLRRDAVLRRRSERGVSLVEYAFVFILFMTLLFGISGFGHALFVYHHVNNAAKEATRYAAVRGYLCDKNETVSSCAATNSATATAGPTTAADVTAYVASITPQSIDATQFTVTVCGVSGSTACAASAATGPQVCTGDVKDASGAVIQIQEVNYPGCTVSVQVQYPYSFIFPLIRTSPVNLSSTSQMIIVH